MNDQNDKDLIQRAQAGDANAFEALVHDYYAVMFKMAFKWCRNQRDAEDITQDACIKLARGINSFKHECAFTSWLYRLVLNAGKDWYKKQNRHVPAVIEIEEIKDTYNGEDALYVRQVLNAVHDLPDGEKEAVLLVYSEGLSHKEAAKVLECKESTISWRIFEARKKLSAKFERNENHG